MSRILSILDLFQSFRPAKSHPAHHTSCAAEGKVDLEAEVATFDIHDLTHFEQDFFLSTVIKGKPQPLQAIGLEFFLHVHVLVPQSSSPTREKIHQKSRKGYRLALKAQDTGTLLTTADLQHLVLRVERVLENPGLFEYEKAISHVLDLCAEALSDLLPYLPWLGQALRHCKIQPILSSGSEWMVQYENSFQTTCRRISVHKDPAGDEAVQEKASYEWDLQLAYPHPEKLSTLHHQHMMSQYQFLPNGRKSKGRLMRDAYFWCFDRTCHEVFHLVQGLLQQVGANRITLGFMW